jgi:hypothetical protein
VLDTSAFFGVLLGAALGAFLGWWLMMKENERLDFRRSNEDQLDRLTDQVGIFMRSAVMADAVTLELLIRECRGVLRLHMGRDPSLTGFTPAEQQAVGKLLADVEAGMRAVNQAPAGVAKLDAWDTWIDVIDAHVQVLWRHVHAQSASGIRSLFRSY